MSANGFWLGVGHGFPCLFRFAHVVVVVVVVFLLVLFTHFKQAEFICLPVLPALTSLSVSHFYFSSFPFPLFRFKHQLTFCDPSLSLFVLIHNIPFDIQNAILWNLNFIALYFTGQIHLNAN